MANNRLYILLLIVAVSCLHPSRAFALSKDSSNYIKLYEDTLKKLQFGRIAVHTSDKQKEAANTRFLNIMQKALNLPNSFNYPFDSLKTIGHLTSDDKQFRILSWNLAKADGTYEYFGFIQSLNPKTKKYVLYPLKDKSAEITNLGGETLTPDKWLGMVYYKIVSMKDEKFYMLLAWSGYNKLITRKIIDVVTFNTEGVPSFGKNVFSHLPSKFKGASKRIVFQYSASSTMSLEYNPGKDVIVFDRLEPTEAGLEGQYEYYAPNLMAVDGLAYKDGKWEYAEDIGPRNSSQKVDNMYHDEKDGDKQGDKKPVYTPH